jgi:hypothetical protein
VAALGAGLRVINISNPNSPVEVGFYVPPDIAYSVAVSGDYAYVGTYHGLRVVNVSNPSNPVDVGNLYTAFAIYGLAITGDRVWLGNENGGTRIVNVTNPQAPSELGYYGDAGGFGMTVSGTYAYAASWSAGLRIYEYYGTGVEEARNDVRGTMNAGPTIVRGVFNLQSSISNLKSETAMLDITGRQVMALRPGANDVRTLSPGVYFVRDEGREAGTEGQTLKIVIQK